MAKSLLKKFKLTIMLLVVMLIVFYPVRTFSVEPGLLGEVAVALSDAQIEEIPLDFIDPSKLSLTALNLDGTINTTETNKLLSRLNPSGTGNGDNIDLVTGVKYIITGREAIAYNAQLLDLEITIEPKVLGTKLKFRISGGVRENYRITMDGHGAEVDITYRIVKNNVVQNIDYCYGFTDPDGGDYIFSNVSSSDIYYKPAPLADGTNQYSFLEQYRITADGIIVNEEVHNFSDALILVSRNGAAEFNMTWKTSRLTGQMDTLILPSLYREPSAINIKINMNGGFLKAERSSAVGAIGNYVSINGNTTIHSKEYDDTVNLADYNDSNLINIGKVGYTAVQNQEYYLTKANGSKKYLNQSQNLLVSNILGDTGLSNQSLTLYVNWVVNNYSVTYTLNGGTNSSSNPQSYTVESGDIAIAEPTKTGSTFLGWRKTISNLDWKTGFLNYRTGVEETNNTYPKANFTSLVSLKEGVTYSLSGYGTYDTSQIRWRFYSPSGSYLGSSEGTSVTPTEDCYARILFVVESTESQRHGLTITASGDDDSVIIPEGSTGNVTLIAQWTPNTAMVTIRKNYSEWTDWENSGYKVALYQDGVEKYSYAAGTKSGGTITWSGVVEGYYDIYASKNSAQPSTLVDTQDNVIVNGQNSEFIDYYNVTLYRGTGIDSVSGAGIYLYLQDVTIDATVKTGYTWAHWTNCDCGEGTCYCDPCNCDIISTDKQYTFQQSWDIITRTAEATLTTYTISYNLDGGTVSGTNPTSYTIEDNTITLINPTKEGYTFTGWTGTGLSGSTMTVTIPHGSIGNRSYVAHWTANTATITIKKDNGNWATNSGIKVELRQSGTTKYSGTASSALILLNAVLPGTYDIYASKNASSLNTLVDTGIDLVMTNSGAATINYYTLTLNKGTGISAVTGGGTYLKNQTANIDAMVSTGYTWEGWSVISGDSPD